MSWVEKELKRRNADAARETVAGQSRRGDTRGLGDPGKIAALWERIDAAHAALPAQLQLRKEAGEPAQSLPDAPPFVHWLVAENGASLGLNDEGIRYVWPQVNQRKSNNFWIRWRDGKGYVVTQRVGRGWPGDSKIRERRFDERKVDHLLRCLVTGAHVKPRSITRRRFWLF
jgi:hypothetical protein